MKTIQQEKQDAQNKYGHFNSTHEVYGVLAEEVDEFWELVKLKPSDVDGGINHKMYHMVEELTQIAAIAQRAIDELENNQIKWV